MLLPETVGVASTNQKPGRGDLRPWKAPATVATVPAGRKTIHRMGRSAPSDAAYWLSWTTDVSCVVGANATDTAERTYFTGSGTPKWTNTTLAVSSPPYPAAYRELGVPAPTAIPTLSSAPPAAVTAGSFTVGDVYKIVTAGTTDWAAIGAIRPTVTAGAFVTSSDYTIASVGTTDFTLIGASANTVGVTFTATGAGSGTGTATASSWVDTSFTATDVGSGTGTAVSKSSIFETRFYVYTSVTDLGEESAPSLPSLQITVRTSDVVTLAGLAAPSGTYGINRFRIYRTQSNSNGADFYFLREIASTLTTTTDDGRELGEVMPTTTWLMPPAELSRLTGLWNGMMVGIAGRSLRFCEAYTYYAWPLAYEIVPTDAQPVALATFGQTLVMLTDGSPSLVTGSTPDAMDEQKMEFNQACIAPLSAVGVGHGVVWASPDGLAYVGQGGPKMLTEGVMTRDDWQALTPSGIIGCCYERRYFGFYAGGTKAFIYDFANPSGLYFLDFGCDALYLDEIQDALFILSGTNIQKFDAGAAKTVTFKSKVFHQASALSMYACAKVIGSQTAAAPAVFTVYVVNLTAAEATKLITANPLLSAVSGSTTSVKYSVNVTDSRPFRLPSGFHVQDLQFEVSTSGDIQMLAMAASDKELGTT